jgi:cell division septum initiation protein DivIVA
MTATAPDTERLRELEADTRQAWSAYSDRLRELTGDEYERIESESWTELQSELQRLEREREELTAGAA